MEAADALAHGSLDEEVKELLTPLASKLDDLRGTEKDLEEEKQRVRSERLRVERILKAGGLIEKEARNNGRSRSVEAVAPKTDLPKTQAGIETLETITKALPKFNGEPFQLKMLMEATGISRGGCETAIGYLRGQDKIRLLGNRPQIGRTAPGGRPAMTYQEIS